MMKGFRIDATGCYVVTLQTCYKSTASEELALFFALPIICYLQMREELGILCITCHLDIRRRIR